MSDANDLQIEPSELKRRLQTGEQLILVDVREPWEQEICRIDGARLVPLSDLPANLAMFEQVDTVVLYCHRGIRSLDAAAWLRGQGIEGARSLAGGIERWAVEIDPRVPRY